MFIIAILLNAIASLVSWLATIMYFLLIIRIVLSWVGSNIDNDFIRTIYTITDLILLPFRRLPLQMRGIDFSPIVAFILLSVGRDVIVAILQGLAARCG